jgi:hypothetical protein
MNPEKTLLFFSVMVQSTQSTGGSAASSSSANARPTKSITS